MPTILEPSIVLTKRVFRTCAKHGMRFVLTPVRRMILTPIRENRIARARKEWARCLPELDQELSFSGAIQRFQDPNTLYRHMHQYYLYRCPQIIRDHRSFFSQNARGFGEDAMHAMWWLFMLERKPIRCLEIGVYRGQVISLWALIAKYLHRSCDIHGISPFSALGNSVISHYGHYVKGIDYYADVLANHDRFQLPYPTLVKSLSTDPVATAHIAARAWDLIYIDGSHDYEIVLADYQLCRQHLAPGGVIVLDDAAAFTDYRPPPFAFAGHPGPSRVATENAMKEMRFLGGIGHNLLFERP